MLDSTLPVYPYEVRGSVRHILILKDFLILCSKLLEHYCYIGGLAGRQLSRDFILSEIKSSQRDIRILNYEFKVLQKINKKLFKKLIILRKELLKRNYGNLKSKPYLLESSCYYSRNRLSKIGNDKCIDIYYNENNELPELPDPFICQNMKTVLEFLKELFLIQLHFHIVLCQGLNFALPILYGELDLVDRLFFWPERPEFGLLNRKVMLPDKLRDIQVELQRLVEELVSACLIVEAKYLYDQKIELYYRKYFEKYCQDKLLMLQKIQEEKELYDFHHLEHSRLVGTISKIDHKFTKSYKVHDYPINISRPLTPKFFSQQGGKIKVGQKKRFLDNFVVRYMKSDESIPNSMDQLKKFTLSNTILDGRPMGPSSDKLQLGSESQINKNNMAVESNENTNVNNEDNSKTIESLIEQSKTFSIHIENSSENFQELKSRTSLRKMRQYVERVIDNDWKIVNSRRNFD